MQKKINEARKQADIMMMHREAQDQRYIRMMEFRLQQQNEEDAQREKNRAMKSTMGVKYKDMKEKMFKRNRDDYNMIKRDGKGCLREK